MTVFKNIKDNKIWGYSDNWLTAFASTVGVL